MAFWKTIGGAFETLGTSIAAGVQLGLNEDANRAVAQSASRTGEHAITAGGDVGGFATSTLMPAIEVAGHSIATTAVFVARGVTFDQVDDLRKASEHQAEQVVKSVDRLDGGVKRLLGHQDESFGLSEAHSLHQINWISKLPNWKLVADLYVPGTHDTMARFGGDFAETQKMDLKNQLIAGIRTLDIRARHLQDCLPIHHGLIYQRTNLNQVFRIIKEFLVAHPNEVIFARISSAGCTNEGPHSYSYNRNVRRHAEAIGLQLISFEIGMKIQECRGKLVWIEENQSLVEQYDDWATVDINDKFAGILEFARRTNSDSKKIKINYCSGNGARGISYICPSALAAKINPKVLWVMPRPSCSQCMMFDYPGQGLIDKVIAWN